MTLYQQHVAKWKNCTACSLCQQRNRIVLARGSIPCDVLFVGEAPGASENVLGRPFVGPAGQLLDRIIMDSLGEENQARAGSGMDGLSWAFTNLVACFPKEEKAAGINEPPDEAIKACQPRLKEFVEICKPKLIVRVGQLAKKNIIGQNTFATKQEERDSQLSWIEKGKFLEFCNILHPASILRANVAQQGLMIQKCIVTLQTAIENI